MRPEPRCRSGKSHDSFSLNLLLQCMLLFFPACPSMQQRNPKASHIARLSNVVSPMHPCEISSVISELHLAGVSLLCSHFPLYISVPRATVPVETANRRSGPASERTSHLTPSPDLSHVALGGEGRTAKAALHNAALRDIHWHFTGCGIFFSLSKKEPFLVLCGPICRQTHRMCQSTRRQIHKSTAGRQLQNWLHTATVTTCRLLWVSSHKPAPKHQK